MKKSDWNFLLKDWIEGNQIKILNFVFGLNCLAIFIYHPDNHWRFITKINQTVNRSDFLEPNDEDINFFLSPFDSRMNAMNFFFLLYNFISFFRIGIPIGQRMQWLGLLESVISKLIQKFNQKKNCLNSDRISCLVWFEIDRKKNGTKLNPITNKLIRLSIIIPPQNREENEWNFRCSDLFASNHDLFHCFRCNNNDHI